MYHLAAWGPPQGGGAGGHGPPDFTRDGASNAFGPAPPPPILGKILLCTQLMYSVFL